MTKKSTSVIYDNEGDLRAEFLLGLASEAEEQLRKISLLWGAITIEFHETDKGRNHALFSAMADAQEQAARLAASFDALGTAFADMLPDDDCEEE